MNHDRSSPLALLSLFQIGYPVCVSSRSRTLVRELAQDLELETTVPHGTWYHKGQVAGWVVEYGNILTFATVRGAAHMVPYAQPLRVLHLFSDFVHGRRLPNYTHTAMH